IDLRYIGTHFQGWQSQASGDSVQDCLEKALGVILRHPVRVTGAGRTDSGVHAEHQVATFHTAEPYHEHRWIKGLNALLPSSIGISQIKSVGEDFHPIISAKGKAYRYSFWCGPSRHPVIDPFVWRLPSPFDHEF